MSVLRCGRLSRGGDGGLRELFLRGCVESEAAAPAPSEGFERGRCWLMVKYSSIIFCLSFQYLSLVLLIVITATSLSLSM